MVVVVKDERGREGGKEVGRKGKEGGWRGKK